MSNSDQKSPDKSPKNERKVTQTFTANSFRRSIETNDLNSSAFESPALSESSLEGLLNLFGKSGLEEKPKEAENSENPAKIIEIDRDGDNKHSEESEEEEPETETMSSQCPTIEPFNGKNFSSWFPQIEAILLIGELWIELNDENVLTDPLKRQKSRKAYAHIITRCDKGHVMFLESEAKGNSVKALNLLKSKYDRDSTINKVAELRMALLMRYNGGPLDEHISSLQSRYQKLKCHGLELPQLLQAANLIISMPQEYDGIVSNFLRVKDDDLNFKELAEALLDEEKRRSLMCFKPSEELAQSSTYQKPSNRIQRRVDIKCHNCGKRGHYSNVCRSLPSNVNNQHSAGQKPVQKNSSDGPSTSRQYYRNTNRAKYSEFEEDNDEGMEPNLYSNVAFAAERFSYKKNLFEAAQSSSKLNYAQEYRNSKIQDFRGNHLKSVVVTLDRNENYSKQMKLNAEEFKLQNPPKRSKLSEVKNKTENRKKASPNRERKTLEPPQTPGKDIEEYLDNVSPADSQQSISKFSMRSHSPTLSINDSEEIFMNKELHEMYSAFVCNPSKLSEDHSKLSAWILDSGASLHMSYDKNIFKNLTMKSGGKIRIANGGFMEVMGFGSVKIMIRTNSEPFALTLENVAYVPALHTNLLSVHCLTKNKFKITFQNETAQIEFNNQIFHFSDFINNNYVVSEDSCQSAILCVDELHKRMAHRNIKDILRLRKFGLEISKCSCLHQCDACMKSKSTEFSFPQRSEKPDKPLDIIAADVCGAMREKSLGGKSYFLTITDLHSDYTEVKFLRKKSDAKSEIINFIEFVKNQISQKPKIFRTDRGGEFMDHELQSYLKDQGIAIELTTPDSPQQNGVAERKNRTLNDAVRTLLISSRLPNYLWAEAMNNVVYTYNRIIRKGKEASPIEIFFDKKARANFLEFGAPVYVNTKKHNRGKLDPRAVVMRFLSVDDHSKGFRLWTGEKVIIDRNIRPKANVEIEYKDPLRKIDLKTEIQSAQELKENPAPILRRSERIAAININNENANMSYEATDSDPKSYKEAVHRSDSKEWIKAMNDELESLKKTGTYELTDLPPNKNVIGCKWVYKKKLEKDGIRYKARLVAQGFSQKYGEDYDEVFAPVARAPTIRLLLSHAGKRKLVVRQFDVKTAFLNGDLKEEIYMRQPTGFKTGEKVLRLQKSLYGLKQAARSWNSKLDESLVKLGFKQSEADDCLYIKQNDKDLCFIVCHVDDMLFAATSDAIIDITHQNLSKDFELKDLGHVEEFLGVEIYKTPDDFYEINQSKYITKIALEFGVADAKPQKYPIDPGYYGLECEELLQSNTEYRKVIGMLLYVSTNTRPDISASVCILAQRVEKPRKIDLSEALRVVKYLNGTKDHKLKLNNPEIPQYLTAYSDANFAECKIDGKSNSGLICFVNGGPIVWRCKKQTNVALSTTEAEYYSVTEAAKEVLWLQTLIKDFNATLFLPTPIFNDNKSCIAMLTNGEFMQRTKYIGVKYHFLREWIKREMIDVKYCPTEYNIADLLTKPLAGTRIRTLRLLAGLAPQ